MVGAVRTLIAAIGLPLIFYGGNPCEVVTKPLCPEVIETPICEAYEEPAVWTDADLEMLACVIYQEAGSDSISDETRIMVGNVVMNRVADPRFPNTIEGVLLQPHQYGKLWKTGIVWQSRSANEPEAVQRAYECAQRVLDGEKLLPDDVVFQAEFVQGEIVAHADGFYFCRG